MSFVMKATAWLASAGLLLAGVQGAQAHHSFAMFDQTKKVTLKGKVAEFQWTNPHAFIELVVTGSDGKDVHWSIELNSPNNLKRQGWARTSLKAGDDVVMTVHPLKEDKNGGSFMSVVLANGQTLKG